jgi:hypothetical protein
MRGVKCDLCDQPATFHDTVVEGGGVTERHLCAGHSGEAVREALPFTDPIFAPVFKALNEGEFAEAVGRLSPEQRKLLKRWALLPSA